MRPATIYNLGDVLSKDELGIWYNERAFRIGAENLRPTITQTDICRWLDVQEKLATGRYSYSFEETSAKASFTKASFENKFNEIVYAELRAFAEQSVWGRLYDVCDAGQYLNGESECLNKYTAVPNSANRCYFLAIISSLRGHGYNFELSDEQAKKLGDKSRVQEEHDEETFAWVVATLGLPSIIVAEWSYNSGNLCLNHVQVSTRSTDTQLIQVSTPSTDAQLNQAHIVNVDGNHYIALVPVPTGCTPDGEVKSECGPCTGRPPAPTRCRATCVLPTGNSRPCRRGALRGKHFCWTHQAQQERVQTTKATTEASDKDQKMIELARDAEVETLDVGSETSGSETEDEVRYTLPDSMSDSTSYSTSGSDADDK